MGSLIYLFVCFVKLCYSIFCSVFVLDKYFVNFMCIHISYLIVLHIICMYILRVAYGAQKNTSNEQNVHAYYNYVKPSNKRFIIPLQRDFVILAFLF